MKRIVIISASVRYSRRSHGVALYLKSLVSQRSGSEAELLDLAAYDFPLFHERLKYLKEPPAEAVEVSKKISSADGVVIVTPEYNGGYPASLKNFVDLLYDEWHRKPVGIVTVSSGNFGGMNMITSLQYTLWKMRAWTVPAMFPVANVEETISESGVPANKSITDKRASKFLSELEWCMEASRRMQDWEPE